MPIIRPVSGEPDAVREKDRTKTTTKRGIREREREVCYGWGVEEEQAFIKGEKDT